MLCKKVQLNKQQEKYFVFQRKDIVLNRPCQGFRRHLEE